MDVVAISYEGREVEVWNITLGENLSTLSIASAMCFSPCGAMLALAASSTNMIDILECDTWVVTKQQSIPFIRTLSFTGAGDKIVVLTMSGRTGSIIVWDLLADTLSSLDISVSNYLTMVLVCHPSTTEFAMGFGKSISMYSYDRSTSTEKKFVGHEFAVTSLDFSRDGSILASSSDDSTVILWDVNTGNQLHVLREHENIVGRVVFNADATRVASGCYDDMVRIWDTATGECLSDIGSKEGHSIYDVCFSGDDSTVVIAYKASYVVYSIETGEVISTTRLRDDAGITAMLSRPIPTGSYI